MDGQRKVNKGKIVPVAPSEKLVVHCVTFLKGPINTCWKAFPRWASTG